MLYVDFVVIGVPVSNQGQSQNLQNWRHVVAAEAQKQWKRAPLTNELKAVIINFYGDKNPTLDLDNMSKPIFDAMEGIVYKNDRQIRQAELTHVHIGSPFVFVGASPLIVNAVQAGNQFVCTRIEDPIIPVPLPG